MILPRFGGAPSVWNGAMLFFQICLLGGYGYAHLVRKVELRAQTAIHVFLLLLGFALLPSHLPARAGEGSVPLADLLLSLLFMVGLPFIAVSAGSSLLQAWYARSGANDAADPFWLYAASNLGSLLGLGLYPLFFESRFTLLEQAQLWRWAYLVLAVLLAVCGLCVARKPVPIPVPVELEREKRPLPIGKWILLAAIPSSLLLGVTQYLTTNIAPIPMLWVLPLGLYLLSFILAFSRKKLLNSTFLGRALPLFATPLVVAIILEAAEPMGWLGVLHLFVFFVAAWMCHRKLYEERPDVHNLTAFYLWISVGGVIGGSFNVLLAPLLFSSTYEYPIALVLACAMRPPIKDGPFNRTDALMVVAVGMLTTMIVMILKVANMEPSAVRTFIVLGPTLALAFAGVDRPGRFALALGSIFAVCFGLNFSSDGSVKLTERSFFGVHRVISSKQGRFMKLVHGNTIHGRQDRDNPAIPLTYYYPNGPIGSIFSAMQDEFENKNIALIGLGVGSLAAYGKPGMKMTFFEIDPLVVKIAKDTRYFTYLSSSKAELRFVLGDARMTLSKEPAQQFDFIVLDAFSSDAIPMHLLTVEAFEMYKTKLSPGGMIALHISNRYLELSPLITAIANKTGLQAMMMEDGASQAEIDAGKSQSRWMVLSSDKGVLATLRKRVVDWGDPYLDGPLPRPWTDDYSNLLSTMKAGGAGLFKPSE